MFLVVRLGGDKVKKARGNVLDVDDVACIFLYRDSSLAPLLDMRRGFKAVLCVLDAMIRWGVSLARSVGSFIGLFLTFIIIVLITSFMRLLYIAVMMLFGSGGIGFGRTLRCIPVSGSSPTWFSLLLFYSASLILRLVVLGCLQILPELVRNSERPGFPIFAALGKGIPALRNSIGRLRGGCRFYLSFDLPQLTGQVLADVVQLKAATAGSLDGWGWRELKVLPCIVFGLLFAWVSLKVGFSLGFLSLSFSASGGRSSVEAWYTSALDIEEVLSGATDSDVHLFVTDVIKSFDTIDRGVLDRVLSSPGMSGWFRHAYFEFHAHVRLWFKLASSLGVPWTRDGGIPQGCPFEHDVYCCFKFALVSLSCCTRGCSASVVC